VSERPSTRPALVYACSGSSNVARRERVIPDVVADLEDVLGEPARKAVTG
jgi:uncharacterized metal-binding protein